MTLGLFSLILDIGLLVTLLLAKSDGSSPIGAPMTTFHVPGDEETAVIPADGQNADSNTVPRPVLPESRRLKLKAKSAVSHGARRSKRSEDPDPELDGKLLMYM